MAGVEDVFAGRFEQALQEFGRIVALDPESPAGHFYLGAAYWWMYLIDPEDEAIGRRVKANLDVAIEKGKKRLERDPDDPEALFYLGGAYGFRARYGIVRTQWWGAAWDGKRSKKLLEEVARLEPEWVDTYLGLGMYNYYVDVLPKYFQILRVVAFIPPGDRETGLQQIRLAMREGVYTRSEAQFFLLDIMKDHEKDYATALRLTRDLTRRYPENPFFPLLEALVYVNHVGRFREAIVTLEALLRQLERSSFRFADNVAVRARYLLAKTHFFRGDNETALAQFRSLLDSDPEGPEWVIVWTHLRLGQLCDLGGRREEALEEYRRVLGMKRFGETHSAARKWVKDPFQGWSGC